MKSLWRHPLSHITPFTACYALLVVQSLLLAGYLGIGVHAVIGDKDGELLKQLHIYVNWHKNPGVGGPYEILFEPSNGVTLRQDQRTQDRDVLTGLNELKRIVQQAGRDEKRVRAYGSRWSTTDISYTSEYLIDTYGLNYVKVGVPERHLTPNYQDQSHLLSFAQSGVMVKYLYEALLEKGLTLMTSGLDDGQTIAGAISTGTHNSAIHVGSMQDMVKGIHLVILEETVFLQKASDPVVSQSYKREIGADRIWSDDDLFHAALVNFGTFGITHGFLLMTEPLFRLEVELKSLPFSQAEESFYSLDPASVDFNLDNPLETPWHYESYINPYRLEEEDGCKLRVMQKIPLDEEEIASITGIYTPKYRAQDPMTLMARLYSKVGVLSFLSGWELPLVSSIQRYFYGFMNQIVIFLINDVAENKNGYPLELYGSESSSLYFSEYPQSTITMEVAVPLGDLHKALPLVLDVLYNNPSATQIDLRFVKGSNATLGFTRYSDITALIDFPSAYGPVTMETFRLIQEALEEQRDSISFTYHWGKFLPENDEWVSKSYGMALDEWQTQRDRLLTTELERYIFSSDFIESLGI